MTQAVVVDLATPTPAPAGPRDPIVDRLEAIVRGRLASGTMPLPPLPPRMLRCLALVGSNAFSFPGVAAILAEEPRLASQIMQAANGPAYVGRSPAVRLEQAVGRLGAQGVRASLVEWAVKPIVEVRQPTRIDEAFRQPWMHALAVALVAQRIMQLREDGERAADAYLAGLLHDVGKPIVAAVLLDAERQMVTARGRRAFGDAAWIAAIEGTKADVGAALARAWQLPEAIAAAVEAAGAFARGAGPSLPNVVRLAEALVDCGGVALRTEDGQRAVALAAEGARAVGVDEGLCRRAVQGLRQTLVQRGSR